MKGGARGCLTSDGISHTFFCFLPFNELRPYFILIPMSRVQSMKDVKGGTVRSIFFPFVFFFLIGRQRKGRQEAGHRDIIKELVGVLGDAHGILLPTMLRIRNFFFSISSSLVCVCGGVFPLRFFPLFLHLSNQESKQCHFFLPITLVPE